MTVMDYMLRQNSRAFAGESFTIPNYLTVGTADIDSVPTNSVTLPGEIGPRVLVDKVRTSNRTEYRSIRTGASLVDPVDGDTITVLGLTDTPTNGNLMTGNVANALLQTTDFDLDIRYGLLWVRLT